MADTENKETKPAETKETEKKETEKKDTEKKEEKKQDKTPTYSPDPNQGEKPGEHPGLDFITDIISDSGHEVDLARIIGQEGAFKARQHILDPRKYKNEFKTSNPGGPPNNTDPYPVDLKIEELEVHGPRLLIKEITTHVHGEPAARAALAISSNAEKRVTKLENMLATLYRLVFRIGSRMTVNCVYYGGQSSFEKYKCIRCLADDRVSDGKLVQLDQCLYCTRFEPVDGQCYEIMNDLGANVATILDDNQMGYMGMNDYVTLNRTEKFWDEKDKAEFNLQRIESRDPNEIDFDDIWGAGVKMDWKLTPTESQIPDISWRQSINDDGSKLERLSSFPRSNANEGFNMVGAGNALSIFIGKNVNAINEYKEKDAYTITAITEGKKYKDKLDDAYNWVKRGFQQAVIQALEGKTDMDSVLMCSYGYIVNTQDIKALTDNYWKMTGALNTRNPGLVLAGLIYGKEIILGDKAKNIERIDKVKIPLPEDKNSGDHSSSRAYKPDLDWSKREEWLFTEYSDRLAENARQLGKSPVDMKLIVGTFFLYKELETKMRSSSLDTDAFNFPYTSEELSVGMIISSPYGPRGSGMHYGIDIAPPHGTRTAFHAVADGVVKDCWAGGGEHWGDGNNVICIDHADGKTYSRYMHGREAFVKAGDTVVKGQPIGITGNFIYGQNGGRDNDGTPDCNLHLHFEMGYINNGAGSISDVKSVDPNTFFPKIKFDGNTALPKN